MKKFFEKYDLFKIIGILLIVSVILTWFIPQGQFDGSAMAIGDITRIGVNDFFLYGMLSLYYFAVLVTFLLILGGFYELLSKTSSYQSLVNRLVKFLKGKEIAFVLVTSFIIAALTSISSEVFHLFIFIPFVITIVMRLNMSKITAFVTTFGSILIGIIGSTFGSYIIETEYLSYYFELGITSAIWYKVALFIVTFAIVQLFNFLHIKKTINKKNTKEEFVEKYEIDTKKKSRIWPMVILFVIIALFQILGYINWESSFKVKIFTNFHTWLTGLSIGDAKVVSYMLGNTVTAFGSWDLYNISIILLISTFIIGICNKVKFDDYLESMITGSKKLGKVIFMLLLAYVVCLFTVIFPTMPVVVDYFSTLSKSFNVYLSGIGIFISSIFTVELKYLFQSICPYFATLFGSESNNPVILIMLQSVFGFVQFFAPTSLMLVAGLSYLDIPYKNWLKFAWKIILGLFIAVFLILTIIAYA